ncbi:MAG: hypothetical protein JO283_02370 [Bradyrhizobium sp.]|nr:hypothetical protein [Bradyrhizobium sp.]
MVPSKSALGVKDLNGKKVAIAAERPDRTILDSPHVFAGVLLLVAMAVAFNGCSNGSSSGARSGRLKRGGERAADEIASTALEPETEATW